MDDFKKDFTLTREFFQALFPETGLIELRFILNGKAYSKFFHTQQLDALIEEIQKHTRENVYFGVAARKEEKGTKDSLLYVRVCWVDLDCKDTSKEEALRKLEEFIKPSIIVDSGNGYHVYWLLNEPEKDFQRIERINKALAQRLHGDIRATDSARILRVPETLNWKDPSPKPVKIISMEKQTYEISDFEEILAIENEFAKEYTLPSDLTDLTSLAENIAPYWTEGKRHVLALYLAGYLRKKGYTKEQVQKLILSICNLANDKEVNDRLRAVEDTYKKSIDKVSGFLEPEIFSVLESAKKDTPELLYEYAIDIAIEKGYAIICRDTVDALALSSIYGNAPIFAVKNNQSGREFLEDLATKNIIFWLLTGNTEEEKRRVAELQKIIHEKDGSSHQVFLRVNGKTYNSVAECLKENDADTILKALDHAMNDFDGDIEYIDSLPEREYPIRKPATTGLPDLDNMLGGGFYEGLHIIGGLTASGKTSFALNIAVQNALSGRPVLYFTYEQSKDELWGRIFSMIVKDFKYLQFKSGEMSKDELRRIKENPTIRQIARNLQILEGNAGMINPNEKIFTVEEIKNYAKLITLRKEPPVILIDYLQFMALPEDVKKKDLRERIDITVTSLQSSIARKIGCPVIALSSISRNAYEKLNDENASLEKKISAFKESGTIEFTAYTVLILYTTENGDNSEKKIVNIEILKNREAGTKGIIKYEFDPKINKWTLRI